MLNLTFLYRTVSTLKPTVGMVVTDYPSFSLYKWLYDLLKKRSRFGYNI